MLNSKEPRYPLIVRSRMKTCGSADPDDFYTVVFEKSNGQGVTVKVSTNNSGIAVVEAFLYLKKTNPDHCYYARSVQYIPPDPANIYHIEVICKASNILLSNYLNESNKLLVACFISLCNEDSSADTIEEIERELLAAEIGCNTVDGELYHYHYTEEDGAQLSIDDIKTRCSYIWGSYLFLEGLDTDFAFDNAFFRLRDSVDHPEVLLFWTFLMCLFGRYECQYPYTLFLRIKENSYADLLRQNTYPAIRKAFSTDQPF